MMVSYSMTGLSDGHASEEIQLMMLMSSLCVGIGSQFNSMVAIPWVGHAVRRGRRETTRESTGPISSEASGQMRRPQFESLCLQFMPWRAGSESSVRRHFMLDACVPGYRWLARLQCAGHVLIGLFLVTVRHCLKQQMSVWCLLRKLNSIETICWLFRGGLLRDGKTQWGTHRLTPWLFCGFPCPE